MELNPRAYELAQIWIGWLDTRRFFAPPAQKNILAMMMKEQNPSKGEPDVELSAEIFAFNLAVVGLEADQLVPFIAVYCRLRPRPVRVLAEELHISRPTFYKNAHLSAIQILADTDGIVLRYRRDLASLGDKR